MNRILVIGGTGNVGRQVVYQLAATGARFRAMTRNPDAAGWSLTNPPTCPKERKSSCCRSFLRRVALHLYYTFDDEVVFVRAL